MGPEGVGAGVTVFGDVEDDEEDGDGVGSVHPTVIGSTSFEVLLAALR